MKQCPTCGSTFTDDSLRFCLQDGTTLRSGSNSPRDSNLAETLHDDSESDESGPLPTEEFNLGDAPTVRTGAGALTVPPRPRPSTRVASSRSDDSAPAKRTQPLIIVGATAIIVLLLVLTGFGIVYLLRDKNPGASNTTTTSKNAQPANVAVTNTSNTTSATNANNTNTSQTNAGAGTDSPVRITASASSTREPLKSLSYEPGNVLDGSLLTAWIEGADGPGVGEWLRCDFDRAAKLRRIYFTPGFFKSTELWEQNNRLAAATFHFSDGTSRRFTFPDRMQEQRLDLGGIKTSWVRMVIEDTYPGTVDSEDTPVSQMTFEFEK